MVKIAEEWLNSCSGCELAILNLGEALLDLLPQLEFVHIPVLMDNKYFGPLGERKYLDIPEATVGIVSGGVRNEEHLEVLEKMRARVDVLVALGTCATAGGIPGLANLCGMQAVKDFTYRQSPSTEPGPDPDPATGIPATLHECTPLDMHVRVDLRIPGCPPHPDWIAEAILALLEGRPPILPDRSVCDTCATRRAGKPSVATLQRMLAQPVNNPDKPIDYMQCLLEQGFMCLGPVTMGGCGGKSGAPRCINGRTPCRGCYGPIRDHSLPFADYTAILAAIGLPPQSMPDKAGYLSRFNSAQRILKKLEDA